ncbi:MAG: hypothetical protein Q7Q71_11845 [Verrucomicrobiota bacterium JB023]|nr:hypothetical protein [Verrucomicrobiota bacterium JB023]
MTTHQRHLLVILSLLFGSPVFAATVEVNTTEDQFDSPSGPVVSLREAIRDIGSGVGTICFSPNLSGATLTVEGSSLFLGNSGGKLTFDGSTTAGRPPRITAGDGIASSGFISGSNRDLRFVDIVVDGQNKIDTGVSLVGAELELIRVEVLNCENIGVSVRDGEADFLECHFHHNFEGFRLTSSSGEIDRVLCAFQAQQGAQILALTEELPFRVRNCTFAENQTFGTKGALSITGEDPTAAIIHCSFVDNAGAGYSGPSGILLQGNLFARNSSEGASGNPISIVESATLGATSAGYNLFDDVPASFDHETDIAASAVSVSRLGDYGGDLMCCFPYRNSHAIDGGIPDRNLPLLLDDIRGFQRKSAANSNTLTNIIDIGAVETNPDGTIEVTNDFATGPGSFRDAVLAASDETNHIVLRTPITDRLIAPLATIVFSGERNYNIDGTGGNYRFTMNDADEDLFQVGDGSSGATSVSFDSVEFSGYEADGAVPSRGVISVDGLGSLSLHRCDFLDNTAAVHGVIDTAGRLFLNETLMEGSTQVSTVGEFAFGGAAIRATGGQVTCWNSSFINNTAPHTNMRGGAIRMDGLARGSFRRCTFARNEARLGGSAIYALDNVFATTALVLDHCTFAQNEGLDGAIAFENRMKASVSACLFVGNRNGTDLSRFPERRDFHAFEPENVTLTTGFANWTDSPAVFQDFAGPDERGVELHLAPPFQSGGQVPVMRLLRNSLPHPSALDRATAPTTPRDVLNENTSELLFLSGVGSLRVVEPGAVQGRVDSAEVFKIRSLGNANGNQIPVSFRGRSGIQWRVHTSTDLTSGFTPTDLVVTPNSIITQSVQVPLPEPNPSQFFIRFVEEWD